MKESTKKKWVPMVWVLVAVLGSFAALMSLSISTFSAGQQHSSYPFFRFQQNTTPPGTATGVIERRISRPPAPATWSKKVFYIDRDHRVGKIIFTYRGLEGRSIFRLDVVIPDLDPQYPYARRINIADAKKGFQVGDERFVLRSAGKSKVRLLHYTPLR